MNGGRIENCSADKGGGVSLSSAGWPGQGYFNMSGGLITGCSATYSGGAIFAGTSYVSFSGDALISSCTATETGWAILYYGAAVITPDPTSPEILDFIESPDGDEFRAES